MSMSKKIILSINGGIGKSVAATAVCRAIKKQFPDHELIVFTAPAHRDVFYQNPHVAKVYSNEDSKYFYEQHIKGNEDNVKLMLQDPYLNSDFILRRGGHLNDIWCQMNGVTFDGPLPNLFQTKHEQKVYATQFATQKPIFLIQSHGGMPQTNNNNNPQGVYSCARDLPLSIAQPIVDHFSKDYAVVQIRRPDQPLLQNVTSVTLGFRELVGLIKLSSKRLLIDSCGQHIAAALGLPSVVVWIYNTPVQFGYDIHNNILANPFTMPLDLRNALFSPYIFEDTRPMALPYQSEDEIFNIDELIEAVEKSGEITPSKTVDKPTAKEGKKVPENA